MHTYRRRYHHLLAALFLILCIIPSSAQTVTKELADGITLTQKIIPASEAESAPRAAIINIVKVDPTRPGVRIQAMQSQDKIYLGTPGRGCETVNSMAERLKATVAVNADFFGLGGNFPGDPLGCMVINEELVSEPSKRVVVAVTTDGKAIIDNFTMDAGIKTDDGKTFPIRGVNRPRGDHELVVYTRRYCEHTCTSEAGSEAVVKLDGPVIKAGIPATGTVVEVRTGAGDTAIPEGHAVLSGKGTGAKFIDDNLKPGTAVTIEFTLTGKLSGKQDKIAQAVGGGCWLVRDGKEFVNNKEEGFNDAFSLGRHPRTGVGIDKAGKLYVVTVDGRQKISAGMQLPELAKVMLTQGCVNAANLDGGGSTTMATHFGILNSPSGGIQRSVSNGMAVFGNESQAPDAADFTVVLPKDPIQSGTTVQLDLADASGQPLPADVASKAVWSTSNGTGFVSQNGRFYGFKARKGNIIVKLNGKTASIPIETIPGPADRLVAELKADEGGAPNRCMLHISLGDANGNAIVGAQVNVKVTDGTADAPFVVTDEKGAGSIGITVEGTASPQVTVTYSGLSAKASRTAK